MVPRSNLSAQSTAALLRDLFGPSSDPLTLMKMAGNVRLARKFNSREVSVVRYGAVNLNSLKIRTPDIRGVDQPWVTTNDRLLCEYGCKDEDGGHCTSKLEMIELRA